jgi:hypothetical protein
MTREAFIEVLKREDYSYKIEGDKIVVTDEEGVWLQSLTSIPSGVVFKNEGDVYLRALTSLPPGVVFENGGDVDLRALTSLPPGVEFKNGGNVFLKSFTSLPPGVEFKNGGSVQPYPKFNIKGIDSKRLLNVMIKQGVLER